jgi:hypothetical protein
VTTERLHSPAAGPDSLEELRVLVSAPERQRIAELEEQVRELQSRVADRDALVATLTPVLGEAIRQSIRESREEMIEALYPIIGQLVVRAVSEAIRDLARDIDSRVRTSFDIGRWWRRLRGRASGVSDAELTLREALPWEVDELFLIHRESGLLLCHLSPDQAPAPDADLISGMLTAIRDFVQNAFGRTQRGQLDEIQYGDRRILLEAAQLVYLAVVIRGVEPPGYRARLRERLITVQHQYDDALRSYTGDASSFTGVELALDDLLTGPPAAE